MKRMLPLWIALLAVAIARGAPSVRPEEEHAIRLIVQLTDGSRIIGNPDLEGIATNDLDLRVGLGRDTNGHFLGSMDEVMIFDRALSAGEIRQIHELQK